MESPALKRQFEALLAFEIDVLACLRVQNEMPIQGWLQVVLPKVFGILTVSSA
jgi:hypothetical protein